MRLDDFDPNSINVEDQRGTGGGFRMGGAGGKLGCGTAREALRKDLHPAHVSGLDTEVHVLEEGVVPHNSASFSAHAC